MLQLAMGLTKLLHYLAHSPYGSILLPDYRRQQFIIVDGEIKLSDMDDMQFEERTCHTDSDCSLYFSASNFTLSVDCMNGRCDGLNERQNVFNTGRHFMKLLLPAEAPGALQSLIHGIVDDSSHGTSSSSDLMDRMTQLLDLYVTGTYLDRLEPTIDTGE